MEFGGTTREQRDRNNSASHDIENPYLPLVRLLRDELKSLPAPSSRSCIYRAPERLRRVHEKAYTPQVVSIGPLHHGKEGLKAMEDQKKRYLQAFIERPNVSLESCIEVVKKNEERLRSCYAEAIEFSDDEFAKIILVDAAFIIEALLRFNKHLKTEPAEHDRIFNKPWMLQGVWPDMRLLENQIPFFILKDLFDLLGNDKVSADLSEGLSITELSHKFCKNLLHFDDQETTEQELETNSSSEVEHFVDLIRKLHLTLKKERKGKGQVAVSKLKTLTTPSMTELHQAGVKFKVGSRRNLFDFKFHNGILEIPKLIISDETELTFRNLLAFEQCHCDDNSLNDYVVMMDRLVNTSKDVDLLVKNGIVENWLGESGEASNLINKLADGVILDSEYFSFATHCDQMNEYCKTSWHKWRAILKQRYFNTPWAIISFIAAAVLLGLTLTQTVFSVLSYYNSNSK